jgi:hypothetical protein
MFDDDILPEKDWLKNCMDSMNKQEGIYAFAFKITPLPP